MRLQSRYIRELFFLGTVPKLVSVIEQRMRIEMTTTKTVKSRNLNDLSLLKLGYKVWQYLHMYIKLLKLKCVLLRK